jgi:long-chain acyl-CoA synthetase
MEAGTTEHAAESTVEHTPGASAGQPATWHTIADLIPNAVAAFGERVAVRHKQDGTWQDVTYTQLGEIVGEIALGLIDLGIEPGERLCILAGTRPEWSYVDMAATATGAVVVPI